MVQTFSFNLGIFRSKTNKWYQNYSTYKILILYIYHKVSSFKTRPKVIKHLATLLFYWQECLNICPCQTSRPELKMNLEVEMFIEIFMNLTAFEIHTLYSISFVLICSLVASLALSKNHFIHHTALDR